MMDKARKPRLGAMKHVFILTALIAFLMTASPRAYAAADTPPAAEPPVTEQPGSDDVHTTAEESPLFEGKDFSYFRHWVMLRIKYPKEAVEKNISGKVVATFIVEKDGSVSNIEIISQSHALLNDEVVRVVKSSPKWTPGKHEGKNVRFKFTCFQIHFELPDNKDQ